MLLYLLNTVAPVFLVLVAGYVATRKGLFSSIMIDGLMKFAVQIAIPCLLFRATSTLDLAAAYDWRVMLAFYGGASISFAVACVVARKVFGRRPGEAVAVGFGALFSNLVLLGLPIVERALGEDAMVTALAVVSLHVPFCYGLGITVMELVRADGRAALDTTRIVFATMFRNNLMIGIGLGFAANLSGITLPSFLIEALDMLTRAALPAALFALGGILTRYVLQEELKEATSIMLASLVLHPLVTLLLCLVIGVDELATRVIVLMSAMSPGVNAFLFANLYSRGQSTAASTVLLSTMVAVLSVSAWLWLLLELL